MADSFVFYASFAEAMDELDKRTGDVMTGYPDGQADHTMDAVRYAMESTFRHAGE